MEEGEKDVRKRKMSEDMRVGCEKGGGDWVGNGDQGVEPRGAEKGKRVMVRQTCCNNGIMRRAWR